MSPETLAAQQRIDPADVVGWGVDADPANNPTYPMRDISQDSKGGLNWPRPALQPETVEVLRSTEHNRRTAVFGTSTPPSGLSGAIRRQAFKSSEGKWSHWLMLMAADRINVVEGLGEDLMRGRVPNIPGEMGIRSEIAHNMPGLIRKVAVAGALMTLAYGLVRSRQSASRRSSVSRRHR
ncbi:MAG: hypothetical protein JWR39_2200 [Devosia sp.]|jgi:hypothetical protein|nr:hypothetical protein [Devosia sp.]